MIKTRFFSGTGIVTGGFSCGNALVRTLVMETPAIRRQLSLWYGYNGCVGSSCTALRHMERSRRFHDGVGSKRSNSRRGRISPKVMAMMIRNAVAPFVAYRRWRPADDATYSAVLRLVRSL